MNREYQVWDRVGELSPEWECFYHFAQAYRKSFETLIKLEMQGENNYNDEDILPILMLFSHYLELAFKCLLIKKGKTIKTHDLSELLNEIKITYPEFKITELSEIFICSRGIVNKERKTLDYEAFRYPIDNNRERIWITDNALGSYINLSGVETTTFNLIAEVENFLKKELFG